MHAAKQITLSTNARRSSAVVELAQREHRIDPAEAEVGLALDRRDVLDRSERFEPLGLIGHVGVEQRQIELDVHGLLVQLARQVQPPSGEFTCW